VLDAVVCVELFDGRCLANQSAHGILLRGKSYARRRRFQPRAHDVPVTAGNVFPAPLAKSIRFAHALLCHGGLAEPHLERLARDLIVAYALGHGAVDQLVGVVACSAYLGARAPRTAIRRASISRRSGTARAIVDQDERGMKIGRSGARRGRSAGFRGALTLSATPVRAHDLSVDRRNKAVGWSPYATSLARPMVGPELP